MSMMSLTRLSLLARWLNPHGTAITTFGGNRRTSRRCIRTMCTTEVDDSYPLTKTEAISYVEDVLQITDCERHVETDPLSFLEKMIVQTKTRIPFSNLPFLIDGRLQRLSLEQSKQSMLSQQGGNCCLINPFTAAVLTHMGFEAETVPATTPRFGGPLAVCHAGIVIKDLVGPGSRHLCDPGNRYPTFKMILLDFETSTAPMQELYNVESKYFMASKNIVQLCQRVDVADVRKVMEKTRWGQFHFEDGMPWSLIFTYDLNEAMGPSFFADVSGAFAEDTNLGASVHADIILCCYVNDIMVDISTKGCLQIDKQGRKTFTKFNNVGELKASIHYYFPQYSVDQVEAAIKYFVLA